VRSNIAREGSLLRYFLTINGGFVLLLLAPRRLNAMSPPTA